MTLMQIMATLEGRCRHELKVFLISYYLRPDEDQSIMAKILARLSASFKLVQNEVFMQKPAEKRPLN